MAKRGKSVINIGVEYEGRKGTEKRIRALAEEKELTADPEILRFWTSSLTKATNFYMMVAAMDGIDRIKMNEVFEEEDD